MKLLGICIIAVGLLWAIVAANMNVTVDSFGVGSVNNIGLMDDRRNNLLFAGLAILVGAVFIGFGTISEKGPAEQYSDLRPCPYCAEQIKHEAVVCKHCRRDVPAEIVEQVAPVPPIDDNQRRARVLCVNLKSGELTYREYQQLGQAIDVTLALSSNSLFANYVVTRDGKQFVIKKFKELRPWFLTHVVPQVESKA